MEVRFCHKKVSIPEEEHDSNGWSILVRFNGAHVNSGNFKLWNAYFFNYFRKSTGLEVLIHQKYWRKSDLTDPDSFLLIADHISSSAIREYRIFFICVSRIFQNWCLEFFVGIKIQRKSFEVIFFVFCASPNFRCFFPRRKNAKKNQKYQILGAGSLFFWFFPSGVSLLLKFFFWIFSRPRKFLMHFWP